MRGVEKVLSFGEVFIVGLDGAYGQNGYFVFSL